VIVNSNPALTTKSLFDLSAICHKDSLYWGDFIKQSLLELCFLLGGSIFGVHKKLNGVFLMTVIYPNHQQIIDIIPKYEKIFAVIPNYLKIIAE
jgi:hypothetical protein